MTVCDVCWYAAGLVQGVTVLDDIMYVVCFRSSTIRLYNKDTFSPLDVVIEVDGMKLPDDMVLSDRQLYVVATCPVSHLCIWRVSVDDHSYLKWLELTTEFNFITLSVTSQRLLVTSRRPPSLRQYSTT